MEWKKETNKDWPGNVDVIRKGGCEQGEYLIPNCECGNGGTGTSECYGKYCCKKCKLPSYFYING